MDNLEIISFESDWITILIINNWTQRSQKGNWKLRFHSILFILTTKLGKLLNYVQNTACDYVL